MQARQKPWTMPVRALNGAAHKALAERPAWRSGGGVAVGSLLQCPDASLPRDKPHNGQPRGNRGRQRPAAASRRPREARRPTVRTT